MAHPDRTLSGIGGATDGRAAPGGKVNFGEGPAGTTGFGAGGGIRRPSGFRFGAIAMENLVLFFNVYLTDKPRYQGAAFQNPVDEYLKRVRSTESVYRWRSKADICKYSLASLASISWAGAVINISTDESYSVEQVSDLIGYARGLFPGAEISNERASTRKGYIDALEGIRRRFPSAWVFFCPNHDHVFVGVHPALPALMANYADAIRTTTRCVTRVCYSHQLENILAVRPGSPIRGMHLLGGGIVRENGHLLLVERPRMAWDSYYISHIDDITSYFYSSRNDGYCPRGEDCFPYPFPEIRNLAVIPKRRLCDHYDGYYHTFGHPVFGNFGDRFALRVPPLFIPDGFFESDVRIRFGYAERADRWVNVNPRVPDYSYADEAGTDLRCNLVDLPYFWKSRISRVECDPSVPAGDAADLPPRTVEDDNPFHDFPPVDVKLEGLDPYSTFRYPAA
jgi:hypothetical protein